MAMGEDGFTFFWLASFTLIQGKVWPHTTYAVLKYFIEPIEDEL